MYHEEKDRKIDQLIVKLNEIKADCDNAIEAALDGVTECLLCGKTDSNPTLFDEGRCQYCSQF